MAKIQHLLDKIRTAIYGKEVRGSLADGLEAINKETEDATEVAVNVEQRQDAVEQQFDDVLNEWTDDKPISNEETIAARTNRKTGDNYTTLGERLDAENRKVNAQLAEKANQSQVIQLESNKADKSYVDDLFTNLDGLEIKGGFDTLSELEIAYPNGTEGLYVVDNNLYAWNGNEWKVVKELEVTPWDEFMTIEGEEWVI